ncbi:Ycf66 family protein [Rivularia sp. UHCC 0363]|uniref:Ycf66 family protein n=1 Tax=Rivularia sp. UHCC 0363 TaxID=3110244 RepID=UPI002B22046C|nr:Ycf66 family protein [Rivularia sp. UHCC 0363]MEA5593783.1 Ycf66 family protein [Rivularia sp. UHCC 0363]
MTHILALIVGFGSLAIYLTAFFFPEVHRKNDFILSGVGLFYALVLWVFAPRIGGWFFLGQLAAVALLIWFGWQTFSLRRQITPAMQQTPLPTTDVVKSNISLQERMGGLVKSVSNILPGKKDRVETQTAIQPPTTTTTEDTTAATIGKSLVDAIDEDSSTFVSDTSVVVVDNTAATATDETVLQAIPPEPPPQELVEAAAENFDVEEKTIPPIAEIAPDAEFAPPAADPDEEIPPKDLPQG